MQHGTHHALRHGPAGDPPRPDASPEPLELVPSLLMLAKQTRAILGIKLAALDLVAGQDQMILVLSPSETMAACTLAEVLSVRPSTVSKMMDRMMEKDLITRVSDPTDARKVRVGLTQKGVAMQDRIHLVMAEFEEELMRVLGEAGGRTIDALASLDRILNTRLRRLR
ncbi:MarR family winged helix-turn-helix transcriptional regulator [Aureimonas psammosilenae]|uniref:MarR family winged helix-turn-helix transcriptional regulator n=1 Tax=Aureimonas psammosilenae TaxID=2495496 RepID=UPI00126071DB|nr:MarR family winged helix-turn-helix transcriptional regulator [Aureimonas psammosilenae]